MLASASNVLSHVKKDHCDVAVQLQLEGDRTAGATKQRENVIAFWTGDGKEADVSVKGLKRKNNIVTLFNNASRKKQAPPGARDAPPVPNEELSLEILYDALIEHVTASPVSFQAATNVKFIKQYVVGVVGWWCAAPLTDFYTLSSACSA